MAKATCKAASLVPPLDWSLRASDGQWVVDITYRAPQPPLQLSSSLFSAATADEAMTAAVEWYLQTRVDFAKALKEQAAAALEAAKAVLAGFKSGVL